MPQMVTSTAATTPAVQAEPAKEEPKAAEKESFDVKLVSFNAADKIKGEHFCLVPNI